MDIETTNKLIKIINFRIELEKTQGRIHQVEKGLYHSNSSYYYDFMQEKYPAYFKRVWNTLDALSELTREGVPSEILDEIKDKTFLLLKL